MPTLMPRDTAYALGLNAANCDSRSLLLDRFCDPAAKEDERKQVFTRAFAKSAHRSKVTAWGGLLRSLSDAQPASGILHAQLQSRLMVNMAGGVMENAGLCLDRFGLPYIPGSAVKGCARRAALAALREWCETGSKPTDPGNLFTAACAPFATPAEMLAAIARVFGWCEQDWSDRPNQSDFLWACAHHHREIWTTAAQALAAHFRWPIEELHRETPWKSLPNFAGSVSFLPAFPVDLGNTGNVKGLPIGVPALGKLELDVVTCHHGEYYRGNPAYETAPDTEEPVPVVFPAVAPGHVFTFALAKLRNCPDDDLQHARTWLACGLQTFGLGTKTNAGYGWFVDVSVILQESIEMVQQKQKEQAETESRRKAEEERLKQLPAHEQRKAEYEKLADEAFASQAKKFAEMDADQRHGFILALKQRRDSAKRWSKKKPELIKPWLEFGKTLNPPVDLP